MEQDLCLGLDLGTTTVSAVVVDSSTGQLLASRTEKSNADIPSSDPGEKLQDPQKIRQLVLCLLEELLEQYPRIGSIGITGQMHGILYLDKTGEPVSPLYTWQDQRAAALCPRLRAATGYPVAPGYGLATHCALMDCGGVPQGAVKLCTIMDYLAHTLCEGAQLLIHASNAASLGFFCLEQNGFDLAALEKLGIDPALLPRVTWETEVQGFYRNVPVAVAIGDNQASFLGSVSRPETMALANFGTGSQISKMAKQLPHLPPDTDVEVRPYLKNSYLLCGSALCGGKAYAIVERFFRSFAERCGLPEIREYEILNGFAQEGLALPALPEINTTFCGTRSDPGKQGAIIGLTEDNFTPAAFAAGTLLGMARELRQLLEQMPGGEITTLAASGNGVRKNPALVAAVEREFGISVQIPSHREEAAFGAALFGAAAGTGLPPESLQGKWIRYQTTRNILVTKN